MLMQQVLGVSISVAPISWLLLTILLVSSCGSSSHTEVCPTESRHPSWSPLKASCVPWLMVLSSTPKCQLCVSLWFVSGVLFWGRFRTQGQPLGCHPELICKGWQPNTAGRVNNHDLQNRLPTSESEEACGRGILDPLCRSRVSRMAWSALCWCEECSGSAVPSQGAAGLLSPLSGGLRRNFCCGLSLMLPTDSCFEHVVPAGEDVSRRPCFSSWV